VAFGRLRVVDDGLDGIALEPGERFPLHVVFQLRRDAKPLKEPLLFDVVQRSGKGRDVVGGVRFQLDASKKVRTYSKGNRQKVLLVAALSSTGGFIYPKEITCKQDDKEGASITLDLCPTWDGTNLPLVVNTSQSLVGSPAANSVHALGPVIFEGAQLGGVQSMFTAAWDEPFALPTEESATLALRTQQILAFESGVANVADPLGGSWYVENLTTELAAKAWELFQGIEAKGGVIEALKSGALQDDIARAAQVRAKNIASGRVELTGAISGPVSASSGRG